MRKAVEKLNYVYQNGIGESLSEDETAVFNYWKERGKVKPVAPARFGEICEII
ncbi:MAG: hypothetical protein ACREBS_01920 [Nitrososphaerales archaeon]